MNRVEHVGGLYKALCGLTTPVVDTSDLLRAQVVLAVSALDYYVHEVTVLGMLEVLAGKRPPTQAFEKYRVAVGSVVSALAAGGSSWFETEIRERHSFLAFQQPDKVADAIRLFSDVKLWEAVAARMSSTDKVVKNHLRLIVDRRNKIAHEADMDPSYPGARWPIKETEVERSIRFLRSAVESIHASVA